MAIYLIKGQTGNLDTVSLERRIRFSQQEVEAAERFMDGVGEFKQSDKGHYWGSDEKYIHIASDGTQAQLQDIQGDLLQELITIFHPEYFVDQEDAMKGPLKLHPISELSQ